MVDRKMAEMGTTNLRAYLRKMAVDGYVIKLDMTSIVELVKLLQTVPNGEIAVIEYLKVKHK